jgi:chloride channel 2
MYVCMVSSIVWYQHGIVFNGMLLRYGTDMVWYGTDMVWYGMVWYGMVWYGMVWYGIGVWYGMVMRKPI